MRLFVAIEIPPRLRRQVESLGSNGGAAFPAARWVPQENLHLTLDFLGERPESALSELAGSIASVAALHAPLRLEITAPGTFPPDRPAKVVWIGIGASAELSSLQCALRTSLDGVLRRPTDPRAYRPHLTVARCRKPWPYRAVRQWADTPVDCTGMEFQVTYVDLMQSRLSPSGPTYHRVRRFALEG